MQHDRLMPQDDTIFALSSGSPPSAVAVVRISGPQASEVLRQLAGPLPQARVAARRRLIAPNKGVIDDALVLWFPGPASATGEDVVELQVHGSRAVLQAIIQVLGVHEGVRAAEPGEFTRRSFENGKIDLTEAEAIDDLIHSDTDAQRRYALRQLDGLLGDRARRWRQTIIDALAHIEASIDFSDEEDVPADIALSALDLIHRLSDEIGAVLDQPGAERLRDGLVVTIIGAPNVGKSTLMNRLAGREIAIVSPHMGTTRDVIEAACDFGGYPVTLLDTAGLRDTDDPVELEGIRRARNRASRADLQICLLDRQILEVGLGLPAASESVWHVLNKADLSVPLATGAPASFAISALTGAGVDRLIAAVSEFAAVRLAPESAVVFRERHRVLLLEARGALAMAAQQRSMELIAEHLRQAATSLGRLLGRVDIDDVLDSIFKNFCIGK